MKQIRVRVRRRGAACLIAAALASASLPVSPVAAQEAEVLEIVIDVTPNGVVNSTSGAAIVRGSVECSAAVRVEIGAYVEQQQGDTNVTGYDWNYFDCSDEPLLWTLSAEPSGRSFAKGLVDADVYGYYSTDGTFEEVEATVRMQEVCNIVGTPEGEELRGFSGNDTICGLGGDDTIIGKGGNDRLVGGPGSDVLYGSDGRDTLIGGPGEGTNRLNGGPGGDRCKPETRRDVLRSCETKI